MGHRRRGTMKKESFHNEIREKFREKKLSNGGAD